MESFEGLAAPPNFLSLDVNTLMGFHLDGEAIFDANMKPLHFQVSQCPKTFLLRHQQREQIS